MSTHGSQRDRTVEATLRFVVDTGITPIGYPSEGGGGVERQTGQYVQQSVTITDARQIREQLSIDQQGFELLRRQTRVQDFYSDDELSAVYERELDQLITELTGAEKVRVFDHTRRANDPSTRQQRDVREPVSTAHSDYTDRSAHQRIRDLLTHDEAKQRLARRFAIVNIWRPLRGPVRTAPLALCDAKSVDTKDLVVTERRARDRIGEIFHVAFNPQQRWFYFPDMQADEVIAIKTYDSARDGRARFAPHLAFDDPSASPDAPGRESIESRCLVFF
jgi:hypothetical protein